MHFDLRGKKESGLFSPLKNERTLGVKGHRERQLVRVEDERSPFWRYEGIC